MSARSAWGPTVVGLVVLGFLFSIPLILKLGRFIPGPRPPRPGDPDEPDAGSFDPDAAIARYMANRRWKPAAAPAARPAYKGPAPAKTVRLRPPGPVKSRHGL